MQRVTQNIRHQILEIIQPVAYSRGFSAVRMDEVAHALGMSKKTLYTHFRSKEELLETLLTAKYARHASQFKVLLADKKLGYLAQLEGIMRLGWQANNEFSQEVLQDMRRKMPKLWAVHRQLHDALVYNTLHQLLTLGQQLGWLRQDIQLDIFLDIFLSRVNYELKIKQLPEKTNSACDVQDTFFSLLFNGILL